MIENTKIDERIMLDRFRTGEALLTPIIIREVIEPSDQSVDALIDASFANENDIERFAVECKSRSTPEVFRNAIHQASEMARYLKIRPMIFLPYLSPDRLKILEELTVSGIDLCGNGIIYVPNKMCVLRTGHPNLYPESRSLANPYRGRSALVGRMLLANPKWASLNDLNEAIKKQSQLQGLSLSQVSKTVSAYVEDAIVQKQGSTIKLIDPVGLMENLDKEWRPNSPRRQSSYRGLSEIMQLAVLSKLNNLAWSLTGESSATRYCSIAQGGPLKVVVSDLNLAASTLRLTPESVPSFANIVLMETKDDGYFFANEQDSNGICFASRIQTWLELNHGDARQRETAKDLYQLIINEIRN